MRAADSTATAAATATATAGTRRPRISQIVPISEQRSMGQKIRSGSVEYSSSRWRPPSDHRRYRNFFRDRSLDGPAFRCAQASNRTRLATRSGGSRAHERAKLRLTSTHSGARLPSASAGKWNDLYNSSRLRWFLLDVRQWAPRDADLADADQSFCSMSITRFG